MGGHRIPAHSMAASRYRAPGRGQGFGGDEKECVRDFRLWARTFRATYTGTGWYGKAFSVPPEWAGSRVWLNFGGVHPSAEVWLNGVRLGYNNLPFVPFAFEISDFLQPGKANHLAVRVHERNRWLGFAYNWQGNWSGLYRGVELTATGSIGFERFWVCPSVEERALRLRVRLDGFCPSGGPLALHVAARHIDSDADVIERTFEFGQREAELALPIPDPRLWSPDTPNLYRIDASLLQDGAVMDACAERVGFVSLAGKDKQLLINGEPYYIRGTGDFVACPETGSPDTDRDRWRRKLRTLRDYGYNMVRCQSYVYTPEYLDVADEVGLLIQSEMGMLGGWGGMDVYHDYSWPMPTPDCRALLKRQWDNVVMRDVTHPSANVYCMSNELAFFYYARTARQCYEDTKAIKPSAMVIWTDGRHHENFPADFLNAEAGIDPGKDADKPLIQHEYRWWSTFPDVRLADKYSGAIRPYGAEAATECAAAHGIAHVLPQAAENSCRVQFIEAKGKMEACRREHPLLAGISHFNAMDLNPSPQGIIDEFYERKYADASTWRQTNGDTVVLCNLAFDGRALAAGDTLRCGLAVSDFSHPPLQHPSIEWKIESGGEVLAVGRADFDHRPYRTCPAGDIEFVVPPVASPRKARLRAVLFEGERRFTNTWHLWLFPSDTRLPAGVAVYGAPKYTWLKDVVELPAVDERGLDVDRLRLILSECLDDALIEFARAGGRVLLAASEGLLRPFPPKLGLNVGRYFFTPPANYPPYESGHNATIILDHPMLGAMPHRGFADLHFYRMIAESPAIDLEPLGLNDADPVIRAIHSYPVGRSLGYIVERFLGRGGIVISALDLNPAWPEARYLFAELAAYAAGDAFCPSAVLSEAALAALIEATALP